jgi:hypothetical protein
MEETVLVGKPLAYGPPWFLTIIVLLQVLVFCASLYMVWKVWAVVITFLRDAESEKAKLLVSLIGKLDAQGKKRGSSIKAAGVGFGATILILLIAVAAIYVIGQHTAT